MVEKIDNYIKKYVWYSEEIKNVVSSTMGAKGNYFNEVTKDGREVIDLLKGIYDCSIYRKIYNSILECAKKTEKKIGDGTTITTIYFYELILLVHKLITIYPNEERNIMDKLQECFRGYYAHCKMFYSSSDMGSTKDHIKKVIYTSCNNDKILADEIMDSYIHLNNIYFPYINKDIDVEYKKGYGFFDTSLNIDKSQADRFERNNKSKFVSPYIMVTNSFLDNLSDTQHLFNYINKPENINKNYIIICNRVGASVLDHVNKQVDSGLVKGWNILFLSANVLGGSEVYSNEHLADCLQVPLYKDNTIVCEDKWFAKIKEFTVISHYNKLYYYKTDGVLSPDYKTKLDVLVSLYNNINTKDRDKLYNKIVQLNNKFFHISYKCEYIDKENEIKARLEDTIGAVNSAIKHGTVAGGGVFNLICSSNYFNSKNNIYPEDPIYTTIFYEYGNIFKKPFYKIIENAGLSPEMIEGEIKLLLHSDKIIYIYNVINNEYESEENSMIRDTFESQFTSFINCLTKIETIINTKYNIF